MKRDTNYMRYLCLEYNVDIIVRVNKNRLRYYAYKKNTKNRGSYSSTDFLARGWNLRDLELALNRPKEIVNKDTTLFTRLPNGQILSSKTGTPNVLDLIKPCDMVTCKGPLENLDYIVLDIVHDLFGNVSLDVARKGSTKRVVLEDIVEFKALTDDGYVLVYKKGENA